MNEDENETFFVFVLLPCLVVAVLGTGRRFSYETPTTTIGRKANIIGEATKPTAATPRVSISQTTP